MQLKKKNKGVIKNNGKQKQASSLNIVLDDILWLMGLLLTFYFILSLASFTMLDPSWSRSTSNHIQVYNLGGIIGAYFADIFYYITGLSCWWLIITALVFLFHRFKTLHKIHSDKTYILKWGLVGLLILLIFSPILEYALWSVTLQETLPLGAGGLIGHILAPSSFKLLGTTGSLLISLVLIIVAISLVFQISWLDLIEKIGLQMEWLWLKLIKKPHNFIRDLPKERTARRMIEKAQAITKQPVSTSEITTINAREKIKTKPIIETPVQDSFTFEEELHHADNNLNSNILPHLDLLAPLVNHEIKADPELLQKNAELIETKLGEFGIQATVVSATAGPVITRYEIQPAQGVKGNQIVNLNKDLARSLSMQSIRIVETIAGRNTMGIELPNDNRQNVLLNEILTSKVFQNSTSKLTIALGKDISGTPIVADLAKMPHLLVAGTTGSGKSVAVNTMIVSILFKSTPEEVRMIMIDPKMLELSVYQDIPHLLAPVVTDMKQASAALNWCVNEMEKRYRLLAHTDVRNIMSFNQKIAEGIEKNTPIPNPFSLTPDDPEPLQKLPYIVVIIDELADLMMVEGKKVEQQIARLAQKARAAGIHLVLATQRPSVDVITGLIKANIPTRISFQVSSKIDSRTILDQMGAEQLLGKGDMLFLPPGMAEPTRLHGAFVSDKEVLDIAAYLKRNANPQYIEGLLTDTTENTGASILSSGQQASDELYDAAVQFILSSRKTSISSLQRHLRIGYNRAANLMEEMEKNGIISAPEFGGSRKILVNTEE